MKRKSGFTLIELVLVVGVVGILATVTVLLINPVEFLKQGRDARRIAELRTVNDALGVVQFYKPSALGIPDDIIYVSIPSATAPDCDPSLPPPPFPWSYECKTQADYRKVDGSGWIPVDFNSVSTVPPLGVLPVDSINVAEDGLYYTYVKGSWELNAMMESIAYNDGGEKNVVGNDGGDTNLLFEIGTELTNVPVEINDRLGTGAAFAPSVTTLAATDTTSSTTTINGSANPGGLSATGWFRYDTVSPGSCNDTFGTRAPTTGGSALGSGMIPVNYFEDLSGLTSGITYYFCAIAENSLGKSYGSTLQFTTTSSAPTVDSITGENPQTTAGGKSITINGTGFVATPTVTVGGTSATGVTFVSSTQLTATAPAKAAGPYDVIVTNPDSQSGSCSTCMTYTAPPTVSTVSPNDNLNTAGGQMVTVDGSGIKVGTNGVKVDTTFATTSGTSSSATFTTPAHAAGAVTLRVYGASGTDSNGIYTDYTPFTYATAAIGRYWVGGTGSWDATTTHWATPSGGAGGASVPTSTDNVFFDTASNAAAYTVTITAAANTANLTFGNPASGAPTWAGSSALNIYGNFTAASGMTRTYTGAITFAATTTGKTVTFNGVTMASNTTFNGVGGGWTLQDTWNNGTAGKSITLTSGTLNTNGKTITSSIFNGSGSTTRTLTLGASIINLASSSNAWNFTTTTGLTFNANTSTISITGGGTNFLGGGLTYNNLTISGINAFATWAITGANTFNNFTITGNNNKVTIYTFAANQTITGTLTLNGNSAVNRLPIQSSIIGTARTLTAATVTVTNTDFQDITGAGTGNWNLSAVSGGSGNAGGNSGITFTTSATQTWSGTSGGNWSTNAWSGRVPLPQDDVVVNAAFAASQTITMDMPRIGRNVSFAGVTGSPTISGSIDISVFGNMTFSSGLAAINLGTTRNVILSGRGSFTFTSGVATMQPRISLVAPGGTYTLQDNHTSTNLNPLSVQLGTLDLNDRNVTVLGFGSNFSGSTRSILLRSGLITITGSGTNAWSINSASGLTFNAGTSTIKFTDATASSITFTGSGQVYNNVWFARGVSAASNTMVGSNTFNDFKDDGSAAHSILFTTGTTTTVTTFTVSGTAGNLKTINSTSTSTHTLVKSGGGTISSDYLNIQHSVATPASTWYAGVNSVNNQGVATAE